MRFSEYCCLTVQTLCWLKIANSMNKIFHDIHTSMDDEIVLILSLSLSPSMWVCGFSNCQHWKLISFAKSICYCSGRMCNVYEQQHSATNNDMNAKNVWYFIDGIDELIHCSLKHWKYEKWKSLFRLMFHSFGLNRSVLAGEHLAVWNVPGKSRKQTMIECI